MHKVYYIIFLTIVTRVYHITFPVIGWHAWRQSDTATIARNFFYNGFNILYPQINFNGNGTGYVESEFHIYPFIVSLLYAVFGVEDMIGRIVSVIFSMFTVYGIYLLVKKIMNEDIALWSSFIYAILPLNIFYGRAFMPEAAMLMCSVYSIYFFSEWIDKENKTLTPNPSPHGEGRNDKVISHISHSFSLKQSNLVLIKYFIPAWLFTVLAILIKLPTLYLGLPLI